MKDRTFIVKKKITIFADTVLTQWSNEEKEQGNYSLIIGLGKDHVMLPKFSESDIDEGVKSGYLKEIDTKEYLKRKK